MAQVLGLTTWVVLGVGAVLGYSVGVNGDGDINDPLLVLIEGVIFVLLLARLAAAARLWPERRLALLALAVGLVLWAAGSTVVNAPANQAAETFPAPGEWLFLLSYLAMAAFIVLDAGNRTGRPLAAWLDAAVACGAAATLAGALLLTPFMRNFPNGGLPLLVALIYPVVDLTLALLVIGQVALGSRAWSWSTLRLAAGFVVLAIADASFVLKLASGPYTFTVTLILLWGAALILVTSAACVPRPPLTTKSRRLPSGFLVAGFVLAVALLAVRPDGAAGVAVSIAAVFTLVATAGRLVLALRDSQAAAEAFHLARTDDLTGLPNRRALLRSVDRAIAAGTPFALMILGLDGFKEVNDTLGHGAGDTLLELVAMRVRAALEPNIFVSRLGGDEFAIVVHNESEIELVERARRIRRILLAPARIDGLDLGMGSSLGIAASEPTDARAADLLRRADVALAQAKLNRTGVEVYRRDLDEFSRLRLQMGETLRRGLHGRQITVWFQPKVDTSGLVVGFESLVRWEQPDGVVVSPAEFLPVARRAGLMGELTEVVMQGAIAMAGQLRSQATDMHMAINLAPPELLAGHVLPKVYQAIHDARVQPSQITIEVTEDSFLADPERARAILLDVKRHGLRISIDDFGTGFSSLAYLRDLPVDELKLDRSFVAGVCADERNRLIVSSTVDMAHALGFLVVAEGVEDGDVTEEVIRLGVDLLQGYYFAKPMPGHEVVSWLTGTAAQGSA